MLNGWATKAVKPPKTENEIYRLAGSWVKQPARANGGGYVATYMTIGEEARMRAKKSTPKKPGKEKVTTPKKPAEMSGEEPKKEEKDQSHIECYRCKEFGHYSMSKECPLHSKNQAIKGKEASGFANATWQEEQGASMFLSIVDNETGSTPCSNGKLLLDNTANISIIHPALLSDIRPAERKIKVKGVGGVQMEVYEVETLEGFF